MAPTDTPDPTTAAIAEVLREEGVNSPNMDADTLAGRIAHALPASQAASSEHEDALNRANERIAELTATCAEHVNQIKELGGDPEHNALEGGDANGEHDTGEGGDLQQTGAGQTDVADGSAPAVGGTEPS